MSRIARVIPAIGLPRALNYFDYAIPQNLASNVCTGTIVRIPFRNRPLLGLVDSAVDGDTTALKSIIEIPTSFCFSESDRCVIDWIGASCRVSPALVFARMVPYIPFLETQSANHDQPRKGTALPKPTLALTTTSRECDEILSDLIRQAQSDAGVTLLLCPTVIEAEQMTHNLTSRFGPAQIALITSATRKTALRAILENIARGTIRIVIGTRVLLTVPLGSRRLAAIILSDASRDEHKQADLNPRYDSRGLAVARAKAADAKCVFVTSAPRMEEWLAVRDHIFGQKDFVTRPATRCVTANLEDAMRGGRYDFLTDELEEAIAATLAQNEAVFLFLNRKGSSRLVVCKDCEHLFACTECRHPYSFFKKDSSLRCPGGHHTMPLPATCPTCRGTRFSFRGFGIEKLCSSLTSLFPDTEILEYSRETRTVTKGPLSKKRIVVGTSLAPIESPDLIAAAGLVGIVAGDPIINPHDFRGTEHQWRQIAHILSLIERSSVRVIIQSFRPHDPFITSLANRDYGSFADCQLRERERFFWPPFSRLVTIIIKKTDGRKEEVLSQLDALKKRVLELNPSLSVFSPIVEKNHIRMTVRVREVRAYTDPFPPILSPLFDSLPRDWLVDTDPLGL